MMCTGCDNYNEKIILNNKLNIIPDFEKESDVSFNKKFDYKLGVPNELFVQDSTLIIFNGDLGEDFFLYNLSLKDGSVSKGYLKKGRGVEEIIGGMSFGVAEGTMWIYDITQNKIVTISLLRALDNNSNKNFQVISIKNHFFYKIGLKNKKVMLGIGDSKSKYKIQRYSLENQSIIHEGGEFYQVPRKVPIRAVKQAAQAHIFTRPSGNRYLLAYRFTDVLEIYDKNDSLYKTVQGPDTFDLEFDAQKTQNGYMMFETKNTRCSYVGGYSTDAYTYLIYSGLSADKGRDSGHILHVFDWSGKPVKKMNLDVNVNSIAVSDNDKNLYAYDYSNGFIVSANLD